MQKLYAFWHYDYVTVLHGEVLDFTPEGRVKVKGYDGMAFTPLRILPLAEGKKVAAKFDAFREEHRKLERAFHKKWSADATQMRADLLGMKP